MSDDEIVREIELKAGVDKVWEALVDAQKFGQWFRCDVQGEFRVGQVNDCRSTYDDQQTIIWQKLIKAIEPKTYFAFAWSPGDTGADILDDEVGQTLVEFHLKPAAQGSHLTIRETGFASLPEAYRSESMRLNTEGWNAQVVNIQAYCDA